MRPLDFQSSKGTEITYISQESEEYRISAVISVCIIACERERERCYYSLPTDSMSPEFGTLITVLFVGF